MKVTESLTLVTDKFALINLDEELGTFSLMIHDAMARGYDPKKISLKCDEIEQTFSFAVIMRKKVMDEAEYAEYLADDEPESVMPEPQRPAKPRGRTAIKTSDGVECTA